MFIYIFTIYRIYPICFRRIKYLKVKMALNYRKLIKFGKNSFVISLPKAWVEQQKLKKGDSLYLQEKETEIILSPKLAPLNKNVKKKTISTNQKKIIQIQREIIASYINNYTILTFVGTNLKEHMTNIKAFIHNLMAFEVMEQTNKRLVAKDFLNLEDISLKDVIRRVDRITRAMIEDLSMGFTQPVELKIIENRDKDINKLYYLCRRVVNVCFNDPRLTKTFKISLPSLHDKWTMVTSLEKIADCLKRIGRDFHTKKISQSKKTELKKIFTQIEQLYSETMKSYYTNKREESLKILDKTRELFTTIDVLIKKTKAPETIDILINFKNIIYDLRLIARIVVNKEQ